MSFDGGQDLRLERREILGVDHPGNVSAGIGAGLLGYGLINIAVALEQCELQGGAFCVGVFTPAAVGSAMLLEGMLRWSRSKAALKLPMGMYGGNTLELSPVLSYRSSSDSTTGLLLSTRF